MAGSIVRGLPITLDLFSTDAFGAAVDVPDLVASIVDATGQTVVVDDSTVFVSVGHRRYIYTVPANAVLGAWQIVWVGTIDEVPETTSEGFTVVAAPPSPSSATGSQTFEPWATHEDAMGDCADTYAVDPDDLDDAMAVATDILWNLTGRRWSGVGAETIRPQAQWRAYERPMWWPSTLASYPWGFCSCHRGRETGCAGVPEIKLPSRPVVAGSVTVKLDGVAFDEHRLDDGVYLVRTDGDTWPCCQNLLLDDDQVDTFSITYRFGAPPPLAGKKMAALYGCQLALAFNPDTAGRCRITNAVQVTRQGSSTARADPLSLVNAGLTGLPEVDAWVNAVRLGDRRRRATVMVPGRWRSSRRVGT